MQRITTAVGILVGINVLVFVAAYLVPNMTGPMLDSLALYYPDNEHFRIWQLVTHMFMHGGFLHILLNMYALVMFGPLLERLWGHRRFLVFYFASGIGAGIFYTLVNWIQAQHLQGQLVDAGVPMATIQQALDTGRFPAGLYSNQVTTWMQNLYSLVSVPMVGASGALYGVLVAFGFTYPDARLGIIFIPVPVPAKYFIPGLIALDLLSGVTGIPIFGGGVAHFAHVGGAIIGFLLMLYWNRVTRHPTFGFHG